MSCVYKWSINLVTNQNSIYGHSYMWKYEGREVLRNRSNIQWLLNMNQMSEPSAIYSTELFNIVSSQHSFFTDMATECIHFS
jgi:hypothetical protein